MQESLPDSLPARAMATSVPSAAITEASSTFLAMPPTAVICSHQALLPVPVKDMPANSSFWQVATCRIKGRRGQLDARHMPAAI